MADEKVLMDTVVFTDIVEEIRGAASECKFPDHSLEKARLLNTFSAGRQIHEILKEIHLTDESYQMETFEALPKGLLTERDSMIAIDDAVSKGLVVEKLDNGGAESL